MSCSVKSAVDTLLVSGSDAEAKPYALGGYHGGFEHLLSGLCYVSRTLESESTPLTFAGSLSALQCEYGPVG